MNSKLHPFPEQNNENKSWTPTELIEQDPNKQQERPGPLEWW